MGRQERRMKCFKEMGGCWLEVRGPLPKAKSKSLKLASHEMEKPVVPVKCTEVMLRGRRKKRRSMGSM